MKYALLIYDDPAEFPRDGAAADSLNAEYAALTQAILSSGEMVGGERLGRVDTATSVRVRGGKASVTDGPFAETKEHLGGFYLVDVPDLDRALELAAEIPAARTGVVEIRPVIPPAG
jgi:hypothetical protein